MPAESIVLLGKDGRSVEMASERYKVEVELETHLADSPSLLAGAQMTPANPRRWLLVGRQFSIHSRDGSSWDADILFLDQDGVPTIVEVKRAENRELRREVVGQVLDYAAGLRYGPTDAIRAHFDRRADAEFEAPGAFMQLLNPRAARGLDQTYTASDVEDDFDLESATEAFWKKVADNIDGGRIRVVIAADEIPPDLQAVVEFLNEQLTPAEVYALGVVKYVGPNGERVLVPRLAGATVAATVQKTKSGSASPGYEVLLAQADEEVQTAAAHLEQWAHDCGVSARSGSAGRMFDGPNGKTLCRFYPESRYLEVDLKRLYSVGREADAKALVRQIQALHPERRIAEDAVQPSVYMSEVSGKWESVRPILTELLRIQGLL